MQAYEQGERRGRGNALFLHCRNCDPLAAGVSVSLAAHLAGRELFL